MNDARRRILNTLRRARAGETRKVLEVPVRRFDWDAAERLRRFRERMESVRGEVHDVDADWPVRLFEVLRGKGARNLLFGPRGPLGSALEGGWPEQSSLPLLPYLEPVEIFRDTLFQRIDAAVTSCRGAIAETGSLVLWPTPDEPRLMSLVPPLHVVVLRAGDLYSTFAEVLSEQAWAAGMPANALLISGPSKSADIEQTLSYGVHGPRELIVFIQREG